MCYKVNNLTYHLKEGDIVFSNSNALHSGAMENQKDCSYIPVTFDPRLIYGFFSKHYKQQVCRSCASGSTASRCLH